MSTSPLVLLQTVAAIAAARAALDTDQNDTAGSIARDLVAAVRRVKAAKPPPIESTDVRQYLATRQWAGKHIGFAAVEQVEAPPTNAFLARQEQACADIENLECLLPGLALSTVFVTVPNLRRVYTASGYGQTDSERRALANIRAALLEARGFQVETPGPGFEVWANVEPGVEHALPHWRLDDKRLCRATNPVNLKCLFGGLWPFAGRWDLPADHERRTSASFAPHRASEDAHLAVTRGGEPAEERRLSDEACFYSWMSNL